MVEDGGLWYHVNGRRTTMEFFLSRCVDTSNGQVHFGFAFAIVKTRPLETEFCGNKYYCIKIARPQIRLER